MSTLTERPGLEKWLFSKETLQTILSLRHCFTKLAPLYRDLFLVILASILTEIGNTRKDGKCVRYKKNWNKNQVTREQVINLLFKTASLIREDIQYIERRKPLEVKNLSLCLQGSALGKLKRLPMNCVDAVITSPPYLNSFDYTDVYMPELWALGFVESYEEVRKLRRATLCSHVQVKWRPNEERVGNGLKALISEIVQDREELWNGSIPGMIAGYFLDMETLLSEVRRVLRPKGKLSIVVGTSSYYGVVIPTDIFLAGMAEDIGFKFEEIRIVRTFKLSTQQLATGTSQSPLRESILTFSLP
jgi:hypothetical protein